MSQLRFERHRELDDWRWRAPSATHAGIVSLEEWGGEHAVPPRQEEIVYAIEVARIASPRLLALCDEEPRKLGRADQAYLFRHRARMRDWRDAQV